MIEHIVLFDYAKTINKDEEDKYYTLLKDSTKTLENIKVVKSVILEKNLTSESDLVFRAFFENKEDLLYFQNHEIHLVHKDKCKNIVTNRRVIDFEI